MEESSNGSRIGHVTPDFQHPRRVQPARESSGVDPGVHKQSFENNKWDGGWEEKTRTFAGLSRAHPDLGHTPCWKAPFYIGSRVNSK